MKTLLIFLVSFAVATATAQVKHPTMLSLKGYGGSGDDVLATHITKTSDGGFITCLETSSAAGTGNIDSFCTIVLHTNLFLKYSAAGVFEWSKCSTVGNYLFPQNDGGYVYGLTTDTAYNGFALMLIKENATGATVWSKMIGDSATVRLRDMIATTDGGYILFGVCNYTDSVFFHSHYGSWMNNDLAIVKVDSNGNKVWSRVMGGTGDEDGFCVIPGPRGGCYIFGSTNSNDYDCTGYHGGGPDAYIARLDSDGSVLWHRDLGGSGNDGDGGWGVCNNKGGVLLATGSNSTDGDVHYPLGNFDYWVMEIDSSGNMLWDNSYGSASTRELPKAICKATDGSIWISGLSITAAGEVDTSYGQGDAWIIQTDSVGHLLKEKVLGSSEVDEGEMIYPLTGGGIITGGIYATNDGSFQSLNAYGLSGTSDIFFATFSPIPEDVNAVVNSENLQIFPNPASQLLNIKLLNTNKSNNLIKIVDEVGWTFYSSTARNNTNIDVSKWHRGIYFVQVTGGNSAVYIDKVVVQ